MATAISAGRSGIVKRGCVAALVVALALAPGHLARAEEPGQYAGRPVADVLRELQAKGLTLIFSSNVVPATLRIEAEPQGRNLREVALDILAPHGLMLQEGPRGTLLVVPKPRSQPPAPGRTPAPGTPQKSPQKSNEPKRAEEDDPLRLEEHVEVTERVSEGIGHSTVYTVDPQMIRETAGGFENVLQTFRVLPGVAAINDEEGKLAVRGAGPEHNLVVLDGVQIHNPFRYGEFTSTFLNPDTASRVLLDASGLDAAHGGRLSSVTVIDTRDGTRDRKLAVSGSLGLAAGDVLLEGRLPKSESGSWWLTARGTYYAPIVGGYRKSQLPGFGDLQFKVSVRPSARTRLAFLGLAARESMEHTDPDEDGGSRTAAQYIGRHHLGMMKLTWTRGARLAATSTVSLYDHRARDFDTLSFLLPTPFDRNVRVDDVAVRQRAVYAVSPKYTIDVGGELHRVRSSWQMQGIKPPMFLRGLGPSTWGEPYEYRDTRRVDSTLARTQAGVWLQDRLSLGSRFTIEPGVRVDYNSYTGESAWLPRVRATVQLGNSAIWAGFATQVQTPGHESLQGFDFFHLTQDAGKQLRNERLRQVVAGFEHQLRGGVNIRVEAYRRRLDRLLVQRLETDDERAHRLTAFVIPPDLPADDVILEHRPTIFPESTGRGTASGVELLVQRNGGRINGVLGYSFSRTRREMYGFSFPFDFDRPHALSAAANVQLSRRLRAGMTYFLSSGFAVTPLHEDVMFLSGLLPDGTRDPVARASRLANGTLMTWPNVALRRLGLRNSDRLGPYSRADVRVTYATLGHWEFYGEVINLFGTRNYLQELPAPSQMPDQPPGSPSNIYENFERFPSFGIRFRF